MSTETKAAWVEPTIELLDIGETAANWLNGTDGSADPDDTIS